MPTMFTKINVKGSCPMTCNIASPWARTFYIYLCKHCWDPKNERSFL